MNIQLNREDQKATAASDLGSILQTFHTETELCAYFEADRRSLTACDNNTTVEEKNSEEVEPEETYETRSTITFKQYDQGIQDLLNYTAERYSEALPLFKQLANIYIAQGYKKQKQAKITLLNNAPIMFSASCL